MRYQAIVSYDGTAYAGWQIQPHAPSVQQTIETALKQLTQQDIRITAAGRTDAGVHALGQVFHFDCDKTFADFAYSLNSQLPPDIHILRLQRCADDFHARYDARWKEYCYWIDTGEAQPLRRDHAYQLNAELDAGAMDEAAQEFAGTHDFSGFNATKASEIADQVRTLYDVSVYRCGDSVLIDVFGDGFLRHLVRRLSGTLIAVGKGELTRRQVRELLASRQPAGLTVPACGLYLAAVGYQDFFPADRGNIAPAAPTEL
jgi:tRNA pseudouridine38-40 synthase